MPAVAQEAPDPAPAPAATPAPAPAAAPSPRIAGIDLHGGIDPPGRLEAHVATITPIGSYFVEVGEADREGTPISSAGRLRRALEPLGYDAVVTALPAAGAVRLQVHLRAFDRIRRIFVRGNGRVRQEEIIRRISLRVGQALPAQGPDRDARLEVERNRVEDFLRSQGYLDARVAIELHATKQTIPAPINLIVRIGRGDGYPIGPITVSGNSAIPSREIEEKLRHRDVFTLGLMPLPFRQSLLRDDLAALTQRYRDLGYAGARLTYTSEPDRRQKHVRLRVDVNERKHIEVDFQGNRRVSSGTLRDKLTIFTRGAYDDYEAGESASAIAQYYRERGHMLVRVEWARQRLGPQADRLLYTIDEGPSLRVRGVQFAGNRHIPSSTLSGVVNVREFPLLGAIGLGAGGYASLTQLATDVDNLLVHYRNEGYPDAKVRCEIAPVPGAWYPLAAIGPATEADWRTAESLYVRFLIDEGPLVRLASIRFEAVDDTGPLPRDDAFLRQLLLSEEGQPFRPGLIREDAERLRRFFGDQGYPRASVEPAPVRAGDQEIVTWQIGLGPQVQVGSIFVRGNFFTLEDTIMLWVPLRSGSALTTTAFERGQRNLALIQLFNNASPISFPSETARDKVVPMLIEVEERHDHWGILRVGGGASTEQASPGSRAFLGVGGYGALGYEHRNVARRGWALTGQGQLGNSLIRATASFTDPRFFGSLFRLEITGLYQERATVRLGDLREGSASLGFAREMYPGVDAALRYNLRDTHRTEFLIRRAGPDAEQATVEVRTIVGTLSLTVDWLRVDNPLVPTRGFKLTGGIEVALPSLSLYQGTETFIKLTGRSLSVVPLLPWLSLRHSLRYDQGLPFGQPVLPKTERYFAGGDTTIRGFELDRARSERIRSPLSTGVHSVQYRPVGGSLRILHNVDLQFPILRPWYGAVFVDSGVVADSVLGLGAARFRHGVGISPLLVKLPIGDISLSWAWPLDPEPGDARIGRLHFNVGLMF